MDITFNENDLVRFGNYLLSKERRDTYAKHPHFGSKNLEERLSEVSHADVSNYKVKELYGIEENNGYILEESDYKKSALTMAVEDIVKF